jgi:hypothetical protein
MERAFGSEKAAWEAHLIQPKQPRARRYSFVAPIELTDVESAQQLKEKTGDLSLFGCFVRARTPWAAGTKVRLRIMHGGVGFTALAAVAYVRPSAGMGISFTTIGPNEQLVLDKWIAVLRGQRRSAPPHLV